MTTMNMASLLLLIIFELIIFVSHPSLRRVGAEGDGGISAVDLAALVSIKDSLTDLPGSSFFSTWDSAAPDPCSSYDGVTCSEIGGAFRVTALSLGSGLFGSLGLAGSLPESLSQLGELTQLILNPGLVTGPVPPGLGRLTNLRVLSLPHNRLSGPIPTSLSGLPGLHTLDLGFNRLSGPIPPGLLTGLPSLKVLILAGNRLTSGLPPPPPSSANGSGQPDGLLHLDLKSNLLVGPVWPSSLPLTLRYVSLSENKMWGPLNGFESLSELVYLDLSANKFSGALPVSLLRPSLSTLLLHHNNLSGQIATIAGGESVVIPYPEGSIIDLSYNALSGEIPEALAGAETLYLNNNHLTGPVPDGFAVGAVSSLTRTLYLQHNFLDAFPKSFEKLPGEVEVCLAYNCMVPPIGLETCPDSAGRDLSRPARQCSIFHNN